MAQLAAVDEKTFQKEVLESDRLVLVDFWATWCGPCKRLEPVVEEVAAEYSGRLKVTKLDVDQNQALTRQLGVMSFPTLILFKQGKTVERLVGFMPKTNLVKAIEKHL